MSFGQSSFRRIHVAAADTVIVRGRTTGLDIAVRRGTCPMPLNLAHVSCDRLLRRNCDTTDATIPGTCQMKSVAAALIIILGLPGWAVADDSKSRWDCFCEGRPCRCTPRPSSNMELCDIQCPRGTKFRPDCSCEPMKGQEQSDEEYRRQRLEYDEGTRKKVR